MGDTMCVRSTALVISVNMHDRSCTDTGDETQTVFRVLNVVEYIAWLHTHAEHAS
jgi:hypothetical protein